MICAICRHLAGEGQHVREAVTVAAGYAACEPHLELAEFIGNVNEPYGSLGLSALDFEGSENCGQCGRFLGLDLGALGDGPGRALCINCACASR